MHVSHLSDLGRWGRRRGWGGGRRFYGGGWGPWAYPAVVYQEPPEDKYVLLDPAGKPVAVIRGVPASVPTGFTFRRATPAEAATNKPGVQGLSDYEVVGPEGEFYGRYKTYPPASKVPLYARVRQASGPLIKFNGLGEEDGGVF